MANPLVEFQEALRKLAGTELPPDLMSEYSRLMHQVELSLETEFKAFSEVVTLIKSDPSDPRIKPLLDNLWTSLKEAWKNSREFSGFQEEKFRILDIYYKSNRKKSLGKR